MHDEFKNNFLYFIVIKKKILGSVMIGGCSENAGKCTATKNKVAAV